MCFVKQILDFFIINQLKTSGNIHSNQVILTSYDKIMLYNMFLNNLHRACELCKSAPTASVNIC